MTLVNYEHAATLPAGITLSGTTAMKSVKIHTDKDAVNCIQLANGYTTSSLYNNNAIILTTDGGFKTGDTLTISGFFNNSDNTKVAKAEVFTKNAAGQCTAVWTSNQFVNGKLVNDDPIEESYTLTEDMDSIFIGRNGGTGANLYTIKVTRETSDPDPTPTPVPEPDPYPTPAPENGSIAWLAENTKTPYGFVTVTSRTATGKSYDLTGGGEYDVPTIQKMVVGLTRNTSHTVDGKRVIVLNPTASYMDADILDAINGNDIIVFEGTESKKEFIVRRFISITASNKTIIGLNGARLKTEWQVDDQIKSWLNAVETSGGTGVSSASTNSGTGGWLVYGKKVDGKDSVEISEEGEFLTRQTLYSHYKDNATFPQNEDYRKAGIFFFSGCHNLILRNLIMEGPGSLDVGGYDLMALIDSTTHVWVDHCEFIDGEDGNLDITNLTDFITVSYCVFRYTDHSYVHQNTNLIGSSDTYTSPGGQTDDGKLNITWVANTWGAGCNSRMPMGRKGKIHLINNYYNCAGNAENAINPRIGSEFLVEQNYFAPGVRNIFKDGNSAAYTWSNNTVNDRNGNAPSENKGGAVSVPYGNMYSVEPRLVPEMTELLDGAVLDKVPTFTQNLPDSVARGLEEAQKGLIFSAWADHAYSFQWYQSDNKDMSGATPIEGETDNTYLCRPTEVKVVYLQCVAVGLAGKTASNILTLNIVSSRLPVFVRNLVDSKTYEVMSGSPQIFTVDAGDAVDGVEYQWYRSANADGSDSTAIDGATAKSYTYNPDSAEVFYLFCCASNTLGHVDSKIVKVKGSYRDVKFCMYATYDENIRNTSVYVQAGTSNIDNIGTTEANIPADADGCKAEANKTSEVPGLKFTAGTTDTNPLGVSAHFYDFTSPIANGDKIEVSVNTSNSGTATNFGFYVCKESTRGDENANVIGVVYADRGSVLSTTTIDVIETLEHLYFIPFVKEPGNNVNLANVVVDSGDIVVPVDKPEYTKNLEAEYEVSKGSSLELKVDYDSNDISAIQWYKGADTESGALIPGATTKTYSVPTTTLGVSHYYCVITGKGAYSEMTVPSVVAKVTVKEAPTSFTTYTYDVKNIEGISSTAQNVGPGKTIDIPATDAEGHVVEGKVMTFLSKKDTPYKTGGQNIGGKDWTANLQINDKTDNTGHYLSLDVDKSDATIKVYFRGGGSGVDRCGFIYDNISAVPASESDALAWAVLGNSSGGINAVATASNLSKGTYYIGVTKSSYVYAVEVIVPDDPKAMKEIVHYRMDDESYAAKTELQAELGKIYFGANNRQSNGTASGLGENATECGYAFRLGNDAKEGNTHYVRITMPAGMPIQDGDVIKIKSWEDSGNPSGNTIGYRILSSNEGGTEYGILPCTKRGTEEEITATVSSTVLANLIGKSQFFITRCAGKTVFMSEITISREMKVETKCADPIFKKGDWNDAAPNIETWNYTISSTTPTAVIHYIINDGDTLVATIAPLNTISLALAPGDVVDAWATDSRQELDSSDHKELTTPAMAQLTKPTVTVGGYVIANKAFPITITGKAAEGATLHYTFDGTDPTAESPVYSAPINHPGDATIKVVAIKDHWTASDVVSASIPKFEPKGMEKITIENGSSSSADNVGLSYTVRSTYHGGTYSTSAGAGIKYNVGTVDDQKNIIIEANDGFVIRKIETDYAVTNDNSQTATLVAIYANDDTENDVKAAAAVLDHRGGVTTANIATKDKLAAKKLDIRFNPSPSQLNIRFVVYYELDDDIAEEGSNIVTIDGVAISDSALAVLKTESSDYTVSINDTLYPEDPVILMRSKLGYTYQMLADADAGSASSAPARRGYDPVTGYTSFTKSFVDKTYTVLVKVNQKKSPSIIIQDEFTIRGGYPVRLGGYDLENTAYIRIDDAMEDDGTTPL